MNLEEAMKLVRESFEKRMKLFEKKNKDYANTDVLANFKVMADLHRVFKENNMEIDMTTSVGIAIHYELIKLCRRVNLFQQNVTPQNESIDDTYLDASNYVDLEHLCFIDQNKTLQLSEEYVERLTEYVRKG